MNKRNRQEKTTFIFSIHDPLVLNYARRIIKLKDGRIDEDQSIMN